MPSDDNFTVKIANLTDNELNPLTNSSTFEFGSFGSNPVGIPPNTPSAIEAFEVKGSIAAGPQGTTSYIIDNQVQALFQFNVNVGGNPSAYFFAGLQPQNPGDDVTGYYLQVDDFNMPITGDPTSFTPTVTVYPNNGSDYQVTPINSSPDMGGFAYLWQLQVVNDTGTDNPITLNQVTAPLNTPVIVTVQGGGGRGYSFPYPFQPWVATTVLPQSTQLLVAAQCSAMPNPGENDLNLVYNLAGGVVITITYDWQVGSLAYQTMQGPNTAGFQFSSTPATMSNVSGYPLIELTVTISRVS
ncbi:MAG TPA: hypothetical protein VIW92_15315 [Thermoanaerobaculia bacterium]